MSSERRVVGRVLDSIGAFQSALLKTMVAVWRRWVQTPEAATNDGMDFAPERCTAKAEERCMKTNELQTILGYLNIGLAIAHDTGVSIGHFGSTDFIQLAQSVNSLLLSAILPAVSATATSAPASTAAPVASAAPVVSTPAAAVSVAVAN